MPRFLLPFLLLCSFHLLAQFPTLSLMEVEDGFSSPVAIVNAGDGSNRLFIVERAGRIKVYDQNSGTTVGNDFLNIVSRVRCCGERGLLGLAFHPDYATNGKFYVNYTVDNDATLDDGTSIVSEFINNNPAGNSVAANSERRLLVYDQPYSNHNAGDLAFGPDGMLWIPTGDGGSGGDPQNNSQNNLSYLGKMLRIDVDNQDPGIEYAIPADNPFVGNANYLPEIWGTGLRNPWRFTFDGNAMWIADVGQGAWEEVDYLEDVTTTSGLNWGWRCYEGNSPYNTTGCGPQNSYDFPIYEYPHNGSTGGFSITGGHVYRGTQYTTLSGIYICADYVSANFFLLQTGPNGTLSNSDIQRPINNFSASAFGQDEAGELYVAHLTDGSIHQVQASPALPVAFSSWDAEFRSSTQDALLSWTTEQEENSDYFTIERASEANQRFQPIGQVEAAGNSAEVSEYRFIDPAPVEGRNFYRLRQTDVDGATQLTPVRTIMVGKDKVSQPVLSPNPVGDGPLSIWLPEAYRNGRDLEITLTDLKGRRLLSLSYPAYESTTLVVDLPEDLPNGTYFLRMNSGTDQFTAKFVR
ncbi:hypothetical protein CEQ90_03890 [Lewinellaceae bacterium SD302]|nr:hypothetical protein CEQ90_03890 [Lewinellaceae bacterium SD302]